MFPTGSRAEYFASHLTCHTPVLLRDQLMEPKIANVTLFLLRSRIEPFGLCGASSGACIGEEVCQARRGSLLGWTSHGGASLGRCGRGGGFRGIHRRTRRFGKLVKEVPSFLITFHLDQPLQLVCKVPSHSCNAIVWTADEYLHTKCRTNISDFFRLRAETWK